MITCIQRAAVGENAVTKVILNGLAREAQNQFESRRLREPCPLSVGCI